MPMSQETFRELLDEATADAPSAPPVGADVAAGRRRLRRRRVGVAGVAAVAVLATAGGIIAGGPGSTERSTEIATEGPAPSPAPIGSPVLQDVVDATFWLPGDAQLRNIRVQTFLSGWATERCGGTAPPLDSTADRFEQNLFPSLSLIREKGFTEPDAGSERGVRRDCQTADELATAAPAWQAWLDLRSPWHEHAEAVLDGGSLIAPRRDMAACLSQRTGLPVSATDPVDSVFSAADGDGDEARRREIATAFADCGEDYFGRFEALLREDRTAYVEQHRKLLERFARQITALGYVP